MHLKTDPVFIMAESTVPDKILNSVLGRIFIVILQTVLVSQVLLFAFFLRQYIDITLLKYTIVLLIGLLAGFSARRLLKGHTRLLIFLVALISTALSLAALYALSGGFLGINLLSGLYKSPDWQGLIQFGLASLGALLVISAFRTRSAVEEIPTPSPLPQRSSPVSRPGIKSWLPKLTLPPRKKAIPNITRGGSVIKAPASSGKSTALKVAPSKAIQKTALKNTLPAKLVVAPSPTPKKEKATRAKKKKEKKEIKFVGKVEHYCPYCLDPVEDHDPRGVKICPICKTRHHADCWGITGACQIPHSH